MGRQTGFSGDTELPASIAILFLFAMAYSYLMVNLLNVHQPSEKNPDWHEAHWIKSGETSGSGYFRKRFSLSSLPRKAYLMVSGTDKLFVYVNGRAIGLVRYFGARPSQIFDVTKLLQAGENLLAVRVDSDIQGVAPALAGRLVLADAALQWHEIRTDESWRASRHEGFQQASKAVWNSQAYDDLHWQSADAVGAKQQLRVLPLSVPEYVYKLFPRGDWVWSGDSQTAVFLNNFTVKGSQIYAAWLGVSAKGRYSLVINDAPVVSQYGTETSMELIDIGSYLQLGENKIWLKVETEELLPRLLVSGRVTSDHSVVELDTSAHWRAIPNAAASTTGKSESVTVRATIKHSAMALGYKEIALSETLHTKKMLRLLIFFFVVMLSSLVVFFLFYRSCRKYSTSNMTSCFTLFSRPLVLGLIATAVLLLLPYDLRIDRSFLPRFYMLLIVPGIVLFFEVLVLLEMRHAANQ